MNARLGPALRTAALGAALLALLTLGGGLWWASQAQLVQLVRPEAAATASLFGDGPTSPGTPIGQPQRLLIRAPSAFLPGEGPRGERFVSEPALRAAGQYPLQEKTVRLVTLLASAGLLGAATLLMTGSWWARRRART
ncbi:hypothetical protein [Deinococcus xianganensis]|uniref:Uncharacterized protein n=1 Tax=Deinococcus xianganensis TaxID=1507289 RepID=A0A6I4YEQ8_9DEIO|nr:hypothetical protein [Deinococcus xianganensis]MXV20849.1 hypothetical protein [Deinococcus xianganensis]